MIASLRGEIIIIEDESLIVDVNGIGYLVFCPLGMMQGEYNLNQEIFLYTHLVVREDQWTLFGFLTQEQLTLFKYCLGVNGIGGKSALGIMNQLTPGQIVSAMNTADSSPFEKVSGIGKKTAQRIVLELKDKIAKLPISGTDISEIANALPAPGDNDAIAALCQLGYTQGEAKKAVIKILSDSPGITNDALLKKALLYLSKF
ncbi:MAG: Holliday junction branch migration protein RuvA [Clostridiales bacterium]